MHRSAFPGRQTAEVIKRAKLPSLRYTSLWLGKDHPARVRSWEDGIGPRPQALIPSRKSQAHRAGSGHGEQMEEEEASMVSSGTGPGDLLLS